MTMCDRVLDDLSRPRKSVLGFMGSQVENLPDGRQKVYSGKRAADRCYKAIRKATRYVIDDDLLAFLVPLCAEINGRNLLAAITESRLPHPAVWIEWDEIKRQTLMRQHTKDVGKTAMFAPLDDIMPHVGYLLTEQGGEDDPTWWGQAFVNGQNIGDMARSLPDRTCLAPLAFAVHPNLDSPLRDVIQIEQVSPTSMEASIRDGYEHLNDELHMASAAIGKGYMMSRDSWPDSQSLMDIFSGLSCVQSYSSEWMNQRHSDNWVNLSNDLVNGDARFLVCLLSVLNYDWIVKDDVEVKAVARRMRRGKVMPRSSHVTLRIDLPKVRGMTMLPTAHVDGASRRQHEVRGHWRRYRRSGKRVWVRSHQRGDAALGVVTKDYVLSA